MIEVGGVNLVQAVVDLEVRLATQEQLVEKLINGGSVRFSQSDIDNARAKAFADVKNKYPQLGLTNS